MSKTGQRTARFYSYFHELRLTPSEHGVIPEPRIPEDIPCPVEIPRVMLRFMPVGTHRDYLAAKFAVTFQQFRVRVSELKPVFQPRGIQLDALAHGD